MGKVTGQCPQTTTFSERKESRCGIEPWSFRLPAYRLTARPNRLTACEGGKLKGSLDTHDQCTGPVSNRNGRRRLRSRDGRPVPHSGSCRLPGSLPRTSLPGTLQHTVRERTIRRNKVRGVSHSHIHIHRHTESHADKTCT